MMRDESNEDARRLHRRADCSEPAPERAQAIARRAAGRTRITLPRPSRHKAITRPRRTCPRSSASW